MILQNSKETNRQFSVSINHHARGCRSFIAPGSKQDGSEEKLTAELLLKVPEEKVEFKVLHLTPFLTLTLQSKHFGKSETCPNGCTDRLGMLDSASKWNTSNNLIVYISLQSAPTSWGQEPQIMFVQYLPESSLSY